MAYIDQKRKAVISAAVKPILARYGLKGSLSIQNHSTITLTLTSGPIDFIGNSNAVCGRDPWQVWRGFKPNTDGYCDVNTYHIDQFYDGIARDCLNELLDALRGPGWFDESDSMTDYFHTAYYTNIHIGRWEKHYQVTEQQVAA